MGYALGLSGAFKLLKLTHKRTNGTPAARALYSRVSYLGFEARLAGLFSLFYLTYFIYFRRSIVVMKQLRIKILEIHNTASFFTLIFKNRLCFVHL